MLSDLVSLERELIDARSRLSRVRQIKTVPSGGLLGNIPFHEGVSVKRRGRPPGSMIEPIARRALEVQATFQQLTDDTAADRAYRDIGIRTSKQQRRSVVNLMGKLRKSQKSR
jgi:hypothetical protein